MRHSRANNLGDRSNALWGRGSRGESRSNALWGRGGRRAGVTTAMVVVFAMASVAGAGLNGNGNDNGNGQYENLKSYVPDTLLSAIRQNPRQSFDVILQGDRKQKAHGFIQKIVADKSGSNTNGSTNENVQMGDVRQEFLSIDGARLTLTGWQILRLANKGVAQSIVPNETVTMSGSPLLDSNMQLWPWATGAPVDWLKQSPDAGTIAVVDSGMDTTRSADFGSRILGQVNMASLSPNSPGDGYGHGTFVGSIAAGAAPGYAGVAPKAELLSIDVMNDNGQATVADVVKAADFILANKAKYNIKVANFSLHAVNKASVLFDPLDQAVEKLWLNGIVVVAASGNYGTAGTPSGVNFAPGNDPFVITVGATDIGTSLGSNDDVAAPFSAYGYTPDGFAKPEIAAPGRYMIGAVPPGSKLTKLKPANVTDPVKGYMQLSGTSFAAPVVAGAAAELMAQHPTWTPDQVKGALMVTATPEPKAAKGSLGVGDVNIASARSLRTNPPNPNAGLNQFVSAAVDGTRTFDSKAWQTMAVANKAWNAVAWSDVAWSDAAWSTVAWSDAAWADVAWASVAYGTVAWSDVAWSDAAWADAAWADNATDPAVGDAADATTAEQDAALAELGIVDASCDPTISVCQAVAAVAAPVTGAVAATTSGLLP
jgi:serine protease AprX